MYVMCLIKHSETQPAVIYCVQSGAGSLWKWEE